VPNKKPRKRLPPIDTRVVNIKQVKQLQRLTKCLITFIMLKTFSSEEK